MLIPKLQNKAVVYHAKFSWLIFRNFLFWLCLFTFLFWTCFAFSFINEYFWKNIIGSFYWSHNPTCVMILFFTILRHFTSRKIAPPPNPNFNSNPKPNPNPNPNRGAIVRILFFKSESKTTDHVPKQMLQMFIEFKKRGRKQRKTKNQFPETIEMNMQTPTRNQEFFRAGEVS